MTLKGLDELDRYILHELQSDARHTSSKDVAERMGVSPSTVRKRIQRLEDKGIIAGYRAEVDFEAAGYQLRVQVVCTAPITERDELADRAMEVPGVLSVRELAVGEENLLVSVVAADNDDLTRIASELSELGLAVSEEQLIRGERFGPYRGFAGDAGGTQDTE
jgi:DNA-binding Lrp family transcriptional regulator